MLEFILSVDPWQVFGYIHHFQFRYLSPNQEFISAGVNAYALGCTDVGLQNELVDMKESGVEIEAMQVFGGNTSLKSKIVSEEVMRASLTRKSPSLIR